MQPCSAVVVLAASAVGLSVTGAAEGAGYGPKLGARHPEFTLPDIRTGRPVSLSDFRGQKVLLIHFASW
jgi:hypothetical protein